MSIRYFRMMDFYNTIEKNTIAELNERGSKFIAHAYKIKEVAEFKEILKTLKKGHQKATHHCFAYRLGFDKNNFRSVDDGEPSGSAGKPILAQIDARDLTNASIIVVRYFGGTMLGIPGLINAYKQVSSMALQLTPVVAYSIEVIYFLSFDYTQVNLVLQILKRSNARILKQELHLFCKMTIAIPKIECDEVIKTLKEILNLELKKYE